MVAGTDWCYRFVTLTQVKRSLSVLCLILYWKIKQLLSLKLLTKKILKQLNFIKVSCFLFLPQESCQTKMTQHNSRKYLYKCKTIHLWTHKLLLLTKKEKSKEMLNRHSQNVGTSIPLLLFPDINILSNISSYDPQCSTSLWNSQERSWHTYFSTNNASTSHPGKRSSLTDAEYEITRWENFTTILPLLRAFPASTRTGHGHPLPWAHPLQSSPQVPGEHFLLLERIETFLARGTWNERSLLGKQKAKGKE